MEFLNVGQVRGRLDEFRGKFVSAPVLAWDLDGTIADSEELHREAARRALREVAQLNITEEEFLNKFSSAFGLPPSSGTSLVMAGILEAQYPEKFSHALTSCNSSDGSTGVEKVAKLLDEKRKECFNLFFDDAILQIEGADGPEEIRTLGGSLEFPGVTVRTLPGVIGLLMFAKQHGARLGICTSSSGVFAGGIRNKLLPGESDIFSHIVGDEDVRPGKHKPEPHPWLTLADRMEEDPLFYFENSVGGVQSAVKAARINKVPSFVVFTPDEEAQSRLGTLNEILNEEQKTRVIPVRSLLVFAGAMSGLLSSR